jgi:hypothetical protein
MAAGRPRFRDGEPREVPMFSGGQKYWVVVYSYAEARLSGQYLQQLEQAVEGFRSWGQFQRDWERKTLGGLPFETDPDVLELLALLGARVSMSSTATPTSQRSLSYVERDRPQCPPGPIARLPPKVTSRHLPSETASSSGVHGLRT